MKKKVITNNCDTKLQRFYDGSPLKNMGLIYDNGSIIIGGEIAYTNIYTINAMVNALMDSLQGMFATKSEFLYALQHNFNVKGYSADKSVQCYINAFINNVQSKTLYTYHYKVIPTSFDDSRIYGWSFGSSNYSVVWSDGLTDSGLNDHYYMPYNLELGKEYDVWLTLDREDTKPYIVTDDGVAITYMDD